MEVIDPEEAWLAAEIDALFADAAVQPRRAHAVGAATGVYRSSRCRSSCVDRLDHPAGGRRPSSRGGRQRAPPRDGVHRTR
ncbi:hypothetical protein EEB19_22600 [Gordonia sp. OPL2]|nr:hypothetical protein EEB19_22600 [Gordonia sp. OPL2]